MKQIDYVVHRPLVEAKGNGKQLDKVVQNIVNNLPANPSWDDIQDGFDKANSYEQTKSSWSGGFGKGITANYFHRVAKKLGVEKIWADDGERPTVISANGRTAMFLDPFDSDKELAKELNDKGMLSPAARFKYELRPPSAAKPDPVEEPKAEKPKEEPEGPRTQTGAGPLRFKDDNKPLDIDNLDDKGPNPKQYTANVKSCKDSFYYLQNLGKEYGLFFKSPRGEKLVQKGSQPDLLKLKKEKNDLIAKGEINCAEIMAAGGTQTDADGKPNVALSTSAPYQNTTSTAATAGAAALGTAAFAAGLKKPKVPQAPAITRPVKPTPDGKAPKLTPDGKVTVPSASKKPVATPIDTSKVGVKKPKAVTPQLPQSSKIVRRKATATPAMPNAEFKGPRATGAVIAEPKVQPGPETKLTVKKPTKAKVPKPSGPIQLDAPKVTTSPKVTGPITPRVTQDLKVPGSKPKPAATLDGPKLKLKGGKVVDLTPDMVKRYPRQTLKQIPLADMPDIPKLDLGRAGTIADMLKKFIKKLQGLTGPDIKSTLQKLKKLPTTDPSLRNLYGTFDNLGGRLDLGKLDPTEIGKLSNVGSLLANELEPKSLRNFEKQLRDFDLELDRGEFKPSTDLGSAPESRPLGNNNLELDRKTTFSTEPGDILKDLKTTPAGKVPLKWFETPSVTDNIFKNYNIKKNSLIGRLLTNPKLPDPPTAIDFGKLATNKNLGLDVEAQDKLSKQLRQSYNGNGTIDLDKLKLNLAKLITIDPTVDAYDPKRATEYVDGFDKQTFDFNVSDEIKDPIRRNVDDTKDRFAGLDDKGIDKDATARAIRDRAQSQLKDIEAEMNKAEQITNAERKAAKAAEIEAKLDNQRDAARAELSDVEGELNSAQKKAHRAHIAAINDLKAELSSTTFTGGTTPGTMPSTPDAEKQALQVADELTNFARKIEKGTYPEIPAAELDALRAGDMPSSFHSKLEKGTYPEIPAAERQALLSIDPNTSFVSKAKPGTFPDTPEAERLSAMSGDDPQPRFVSDEKPGTFEPDTEIQAARDRIEELQKKSAKAAAELKQTELADQQFVKDYQDAITAEKIRHRQEILRLEKIQAQGQAGRDAAAEERRAKAYQTEIDQLAADKQAAIQKGWEAITSQEAARGEQLVDDDTRKVLAQDAGIDDWKYDPTLATSQVNKAAAQQSDAAQQADRISKDAQGITQRPAGEPDMSGNTAVDKINKATAAIKGDDAAPDMTLGSQQANDAAARQAASYKPKNFKPDMLLGQNFKEFDDELAKAIDDSRMLQSKRDIRNDRDLKERNPELHAELSADGKPPTKEKAKELLDSMEYSGKAKQSFITKFTTSLNQMKADLAKGKKELQPAIDMVCQVAPGCDAAEAGSYFYEKVKASPKAIKNLLQQNKTQLIQKVGKEAFELVMNPKAAARVGAKIGMKASFGALGLLMVLVDVYDIVNILVMLGVIDDPNDKIQDARQKDIDRIKEIMIDKSLSNDEKRAKIKEMLKTKELDWYAASNIFGALDVWAKDWGIDDELDNIWQDESFMNETSMYKPITVKTGDGEEQNISYSNIENFEMSDLKRNPYKSLDIQRLYEQLKDYASKEYNNLGYIMVGQRSQTLPAPNELEFGAPGAVLYYVQHDPRNPNIPLIQVIDVVGGRREITDVIGERPLMSGTPPTDIQQKILKAVNSRHLIPDLDFVDVDKLKQSGSEAFTGEIRGAVKNAEKNAKRTNRQVDVKGGITRYLNTYDTFDNADEITARNNKAKEILAQLEKMKGDVAYRHSFLDMGKIHNWEGFETQEADALKKHYNRLLDLQKYAGMNESRKTQLQGRIKLLRERIKQYKKVNIIKG